MSARLPEGNLKATFDAGPGLVVMQEVTFGAVEMPNGDARRPFPCPRGFKGYIFVRGATELGFRTYSGPGNFLVPGFQGASAHARAVLVWSAAKPAGVEHSCRWAGRL